MAQEVDRPAGAAEILPAGNGTRLCTKCVDGETLRSDETETVDVQGELLECDILEGESEAELGDQTVTVLHRLLLNDEIPFGLAGFGFGGTPLVVELAGKQRRQIAELVASRLNGLVGVPWKYPGTNHIRDADVAPPKVLFPKQQLDNFPPLAG